MYDLCVIGGGWGGFSAAKRAAQLGKTVCLIEKEQVGGVCLNRGCIPTKVLVNSSNMLGICKNASIFGVDAKAGFDFARILQRKTEVIDKLRKGMQYQLKINNIDFIKGSAKITSPVEITVEGKKIQTKNIIIATGSRPIELPNFKFDGKKIISSDDILDMDSIPASLLIVGGGVIGCEFASIFSEFGSKITIVELLEQILPTEDVEIAKKLEITFKKKGLRILTKTNADSINQENFDKILVSVGRRPNIDGLGLENLGVETSKRGIAVNEYLMTNIESIYAVGDCIGGVLLAHVASYEGILAAENIFVRKRPVNYRGVANCIFTHPEIGSVGLNEARAKESSASFRVARFNFLACGMAHILGETDGFIKLIIDENTEEIVGASIIGPKATELITALAIAVRNKTKISQIKDAIIAHPTLSEGILEAAREYYSVKA
jgi:dihydrolipoamide dehydrogenase